MKLYAELENENGKREGIGGNEEISATVYYKNKKLYTVYIRYTDIGDIALEEGDENLPEFHAEKGPLITVRDWRKEQ